MTHEARLTKAGKTVEEAARALTTFLQYLRRGELLGLKWSDINLSEGVISVQRSLVDVKGGIIESKPKSAKGYRSIVLSSFALDTVREHRERQIGMRCTQHSGRKAIMFSAPRMVRRLRLRTCAPCSSHCCRGKYQPLGFLLSTLLSSPFAMFCEMPCTGLGRGLG